MCTEKKAACRVHILAENIKRMEGLDENRACSLFVFMKN